MRRKTIRSKNLYLPMLHQAQSPMLPLSFRILEPKSAQAHPGDVPICLLFPDFFFLSKKVQGPFSNVQRTSSTGICWFKLYRICDEKDTGATGAMGATGATATEPRVVTEFLPKVHLMQLCEHSLWVRHIPLNLDYDKVIIWSFSGWRKAAIILSLCPKLYQAPWSFSAGAQHPLFM